MNENLSFIGKFVEKFLTGYNALIFISLAIAMGIGAILMTPREEEPQIVVPLANIFVQYPGASAKEVECLVAHPLEKLLWQIDGVEYVYSTSRRDMAVVTVRFYVGQDRERSLVKLYNKIHSHIDMVAPGISSWVVKPIEIDDVPIITFTLYRKESQNNADYELRRIGEEIINRLESLENISRTQMIGGLSREVRVELDVEKMAGYSLSPLEIYQSLARQNASLSAGAFARGNKMVSVYSGPFLRNVEEVRNLVVGIHDSRPVHLKDVAMLYDGPRENNSYVRIGFGPQAQKPLPSLHSLPAITLAIAKKKGTNAVEVAQNLIQKMEELRQTVIPQDIEIVVTRNYGATADQKVNELIGSLFFSIITVIGLLAFSMGWREALVVSFAVPISFALSLFVNLISGYTINRVTLFALILSLGLVVDDPTTNVDNIQRHILAGKRKNPLLETLFAVQEVLPPVIMSTLTIIVSFLPMFFITGMMGPYMGPMAINVPLTVTFSTVCALTFVPWLSYTLLKNKHGQGKRDSSEKSGYGGLQETWVMRFYKRLTSPFLNHRWMAYSFLGTMLLLLVFSGLLAATGLVPLKMLPFDNKNEFQIVIDMPDGTTLEQTKALVDVYEKYLAEVIEVTNVVSYIGIASPIDFNGLVRQYFLRQAPHLADIRINLVEKEKRSQQSHAILLRLRKDLERIAREYNASIKLVEVPPGPPVISTVVAEITGTPAHSYQDLIEAAKIAKKRMEEESGVVDIDWTVEEDYQEYQFELDKTKASLHGVDTESIVKTLRLALSGFSPGNVHILEERQPLLLNLILPRKDRSGIQELSRIHIKGQTGSLVSLGEIGKFVEQKKEKSIYHKNFIPVVYVMAEMAGRAPAEAILSLQSHFKKNPLPPGISLNWAGEGEWHITLTVFRDLGIAFAVALLGIYFLIVIETGSLFMPVIIMMAIPLTAIGIMPGFYLLNLISNNPVGGFADPVFFTATGMIGMIALGGIVVRNSIVLIEFIKTAQEEGLEFKEAILKSGGVRFRPIMLTAATTAVGAWPITLDPVFSGLAWALIFGIVASTLFSLLVVPVVYYWIYKNKQ